jgi:hypothetical protein
MKSCWMGYGAFVPHYSDICSPLTALTGKGVPFEWTPECARAFTELKKLLRSDVFLAAYDWDKPAYLETDASNVAYAGLLPVTPSSRAGIAAPPLWTRRA